MNTFIHAIDGFYTNDVFYTDCDSLYIENKHWGKLDKAGLVGKELLRGKNDYEDGGIFYGLFLAPKIKYCLTIKKFGIISEHKTFKGFTDVHDSLDRKKYFNLADDDKLAAKVPLSWKKSFSRGVVIPHKMRNCHECKKDILCDNCDKLVNQKKELSANLNELKRKKPNDYGHMLPELIIQMDGVTKDTPIMIKENEIIKIKRNEIADECNNIQIWTSGGWRNIKELVRHKTEKNIYRVRTKHGIVDITEDYSLINRNREIIKPCDLKIGEELLHN